MNTEHPAPLVLLMATVWPAQPWMSRKKTLTRGVLRWCCVCGEEEGGGEIYPCASHPGHSSMCYRCCGCPTVP